MLIPFLWMSHRLLHVPKTGHWPKSSKHTSHHSPLKGCFCTPDPLDWDLPPELEAGAGAGAGAGAEGAVSLTFTKSQALWRLWGLQWAFFILPPPSGSSVPTVYDLVSLIDLKFFQHSSHHLAPVPLEYREEKHPDIPHPVLLLFLDSFWCLELFREENSKVLMGL